MRATGQAAASDQRQGILVLISDIRDIVVDLCAGSYTRTALAMFDRDLFRVAPGALGASISVEQDDPTTPPGRIDLVRRVLMASEIHGGLRVPLRPFCPRRQGHVTFYASAPRALDPLADGLTDLGVLDAGDVDSQPERPTASLGPSTAGLDDYSEVNRALGVLVSRGYKVADARNWLENRAIYAGMSLSEAAHEELSLFG